MADPRHPRLAPLSTPAPRPPSRRMRAVRGAVLRLVVLGLAGTGAWAVGTTAADEIERVSRARVAAALASAGFDWTNVATDGLLVRLTGPAPDEVQRFRALDRAATVVDGRRIVDAMTLASPPPTAAPLFSVELLRNDAGVSLIGLVPAGVDRAALLASVERATGGRRVTDLLESSDQPAPDDWDAALRFGIAAIAVADRSKVSVTPGKVDVTAITDGEAEKARLAATLDRDRPEGVALTTSISAPRPVVTPFALRMVKDADGTRLEACAADTEDARSRILDAARAAGVAQGADCTLALGVPSPTWGDAAVAGIAALGALDAGTIEFSNAQVGLTAPASVPADQYDRAAGGLQGALPSVFTLTAVHTAPEPEPAEAGPAEFTATRVPTGIALRGRITDEAMRQAVESLARARFGTVESSLLVDPQTPPGWTVRVMAAIEAMADLDDGTVKVTPDLVRLTGASGSNQAAEGAARQLSYRLGAGVPYEMAIRYDRRLDPALDLPTGQDCVDRMNVIMAQAEIGFEPSSSTIAGDAAPTLTQLADAASECGDYRIEVAGHTDSQGSENFNAELSRTRAQAVVAAMGGAGIAIANMTVRGYGESQPVDTNDTDAGREANRRIEFRLLSDTPVEAETPPAPRVVTGVTVADVPAPGEMQGPNLPAEGAAARPPGDAVVTGNDAAPDPVDAAAGAEDVGGAEGADAASTPAAADAATPSGPTQPGDGAEPGDGADAGGQPEPAATPDPQPASPTAPTPED